MAKFEDRQAIKCPIDVRHMHPNQTGITKNIHNVDKWYDEKKNLNSFLQGQIEYRNRTNKQNH